MKYYNFAIVGCGFIARKHFQAINGMPNCRLVAVHDIDISLAGNFAVATGAKVYDCYKKLLNDPQVDIINLCVPGGLHARMAIEAARHGKNILVEKPLAVNLRDADALIKACEQAGVILATAHQNRFKPPVAALKKVIEQGHMGSIYYAVASLRWNRNADYYLGKQWRCDHQLGGGVLFNQSIHNIDLLQWMLGPVKTVYGHTVTGISPLKADGTALAVLQFQSGALGMIEASTTIYPESLEETLSVFGTKGTVILGGKSISQVKTWRLAGNMSKPENYVVDPADPGGYRLLFEDLIKCLESGCRPVVDGREGRKALQIILAIKHANDTCLPVNFSV